MRFFRSLQRLTKPKFRARLAPETPLAVIGDVHGRADLLEKLVDLLKTQNPSGSTLVCVGDYIDRGDQSAQALELVQDLQRGGGHGEIVCLKGNHEQMMLDFIDSPEETGRFWLRNGGAHTLASYGIDAGSQDPAALRAHRNQLRDRMPRGTEAWLRGLPVSYCSGNVFVAHAGADPNVPIDQQEETHLLWGHPDFERMVRRDGVWVVHGHTIREQAGATLGRICVDTGAYATNRLSAAVIADGECHFLSTDV